MGDRLTARAAVGLSRRGPGAAVRVFGRKRAYRRGTSVSSVAYETFKEAVTIVADERNVRGGASTTRRPLRGASEAAGQGLEPQLPEPESGVLPLDDPAGLGRIVAASLAASDVEPVLGNEPLLVCGVDVRDHLDVRLEAGAAKLRLQQPVDLEEAR